MPRSLTMAVVSTTVGLGVLVLPAAWTGRAAVPASPSANGGALLRSQYANLPLAFEANHGQAPPEVDFLSRGGGYTLLLTRAEAMMIVPEAGGCTSVRMKLDEANVRPKVVGLEPQPGRVHYLRGRDPSQWRSGIPTYARVHYDSVYPGIDLVYYGNQRHLEFDFVMRPGADPTRIGLTFEGAESVESDADGDIVLRASGSAIRFRKPVAYQEIEGERRHVSGDYRLDGARVTFALGEYDSTRPLTIDPVLVFSSYLGGSDLDSAVTGGGNGIAVDDFGNVYVTGTTLSPDFPTAAAIDGTFGGGRCDPNPCPDAFVTKMNSSGTTILYSTYLGGSGWDRAVGIAVDRHGSAYVTGDTHSFDFPLTAGSFQHMRRGFSDAFVLKLNSAGSAIE